MENGLLNLQDYKQFRGEPGYFAGLPMTDIEQNSLVINYLVKPEILIDTVAQSKKYS